MAGYTGPSNPNPDDGNAAILEYGYAPSLAMGIIGVIAFLAVAGPHLFYLFTRRGTRSVHGLLFFVGVCEALGYGARLYSHNHPYGGMPFLIGIYLIQVATILVTAALYKSIQRVLKYTPEGSQLSPMRPRSLLAVFVTLDAVWAVFQIAGQYFIAAAESAIITDDDPMFATGTSGMIFLAGNVLQAITIIIVSVFVFVIKKRAARLLATANPNVQYPLVQPLLNQVLISLGLFFIRLVVRIAEGAQGIYGYAGTHEWVFGVFEFAPILLIVALWAAKPLYKFIFPLGHRHGEGAHVRDDIPVTGAISASNSSESKV